MSEGLDIGLNSFKKLPRNEKDALIYENILHIKKKVSSFYFYRKINYAWLCILTIATVGEKYIPII